MHNDVEAKAFCPMIPRIVPHYVLPHLRFASVGAKRVPLALSTLKTFEIRPVRATFSCFAGPKVMLFMQT